tara:strand:- start:209 stop:667 length:459 start_codon:yes stop_codon:yes gene_type:complete
MAMSPRKKEAGAGSSSGSVVNLGNAGPRKPKKMRGGGPAGSPMMPKKPKKMRGGGDVGGPMKMKDGGFPDLSGDGKVTQKDILMGKGVIKKNVGGPLKASKKSGVMRRNNGGPIKASKKSGVMRRNMGGKVSKKSGVMKGMRSGGPAKKKGG